MSPAKIWDRIWALLPALTHWTEIDPVTKDPRFRVIGLDLWSDDPGFAQAVAQTGVTGICGSGIIEAVAEMRMAGLLDPSGLIGSAEQTGTPRCEAEGRTHAYLIHDGSAEGGPRITVTQGDIRAIQLAKSALYAGARLLMDERGADRVDRIVLAGAFGAHISPKHAMVLGMIPDAPLDKVTSAGNAAGTGARIALLNTEARSLIEETVRAIHKVETAIEPRFQEHFVNASAIPNAVEPFPILNSIVTLPTETFNTGDAPVVPPRTSEKPRIAVSRSRPPAFVQALAEEMGAELVPMGSAGVKMMSVVRDVADAYVHAGGQYEWDSAAPVAVARAAGLFTSRVNGDELVYNQDDVYLPDLIVCRPELSEQILAFIAEHGTD